jgi:type I restriction enzyme, S subunit
LKKLCLGDFFSNRQEHGRVGLPVMSVTMNDSLVLRDDMERRTESALSPEQHLLVKKGDIAYNMMRMWQGACGLAEADGIVSPAYVVLAPKPNMDSRFAYHWFKSAGMIHLFWAYSHGLTEDRLRLYFDAFSEIPTAPPSVEQQKRISNLLDSWDQAINQTAQLIIAKQRQLACVRKILLSDLADAQTELGDLAQVSSGVPAPQEKSAFCTVGNRFVRVSDLAAFVGEKPDEPEFLTETASRGIRLFDAGTIIFAKSGMSAQLSRVVRLPESAHLVSHLGAVNAKVPALQSYLYHWLVENPPSSLLQGDGFPSIRISEVAKLPVPALGENHAAEIGAALDSLETEIEKFVQQIDFLRKQKRGLMQKLLTGEWQLDGRFDQMEIATQGNG